MYRTNRQLLKEPSIHPSKLSAVYSGHLKKTFKACADAARRIFEVGPR
jgi:hypothetical protein